MSAEQNTATGVLTQAPRLYSGVASMTGPQGPAGPNEISTETAVRGIAEGLYLAVEGSRVVGRSGGSGGGASDMAWWPTVSAEGLLSWTRAETATPPVAVSIRGPQGPAGERGATGERGPQGLTGATGATGARGAAGADGVTPVRGVDYWTAADRAQMVAEVLAALPDGNGVAY